MFFFNSFRLAGRMLRTAMGFLCCFCIGGPVLFIIGIVMIALPNTREDDVKQYNDAVLAYNGSVVDSWIVGGAARIGGQTVVVSSTRDPIEGNTESITTVGTSRVAAASSVMVTGSSVAFNLVDVQSFTWSGIQLQKTNSATLSCSSSNGCSRLTMSSRCTSSYGSSASYTGNGCSSSGSCGSCRYTANLQEICAVVTSTPPHTRDVTLSSCYYPFSSSSHVYSSSSSDSSVTGISVYVRASSDPFIVLQRVTEGSNDFGMTKADQQSIGIALLVVGIILTICTCITCALLYVCCLKALVGGGGAVPVSPGMGMVMGGAIVAPPPSYPVTTTQAVIVQPMAVPMQPMPPMQQQQQQGYGNGGGYVPQPGYGQPQPQPQPAMGQPMYYNNAAQQPPMQQQQYATGVPPQGPGEYAMNNNQQQQQFQQPQYATGVPPQGHGFDYTNHTNGGGDYAQQPEKVQNSNNGGGYGQPPPAANPAYGQQAPPNAAGGYGQPPAGYGQPANNGYDANTNAYYNNNNNGNVPPPGKMGGY